MRTVRYINDQIILAIGGKPKANLTKLKQWVTGFTSNTEVYTGYKFSVE